MFAVGLGQFWTVVGSTTESSAGGCSSRTPGGRGGGRSIRGLRFNPCTVGIEGVLTIVRDFSSLMRGLLDVKSAHSVEMRVADAARVCACAKMRPKIDAATTVSTGNDIQHYSRICIIHITYRRTREGCLFYFYVSLSPSLFLMYNKILRVLRNNSIRREFDYLREGFAWYEDVIGMLEVIKRLSEIRPLYFIRITNPTETLFSKSSDYL